MLVLLSTAITTVAIVSLNGISKDVRSMSTDTIPGIVYASAIRNDVLALRGDFLKHIAESDEAGLNAEEQSIATNDAHLAEDMKDYEDSLQYEDAAAQTDDRDLLSKLKPEIAAVHQGWDKVRPISRAGKNVDAFELYTAEVTPTMDQLRVQLAGLVDANKKASDATDASTTQTVQTSWWLALILGTVCVLAGSGVSWYMIRALNRELNVTVAELSEGAVQIASAASQVASSSQSLAQGSSEQAASLEETSATTNEINSMASRNTDNAGSMTKMVSESQQEFLDTNRQLDEMVAAMDEINDSSTKISKIIKVIDEIAFQTNILALNAAVEAARAGEAGMGFAVVADEVRNLAQRCAQAAKDTAELIEDSIGRSGSGKAKVALVASAIQRMTEDFSKVKMLVDEVGLGSREQTDGIEQIRRALSQMEQVSQSTAATAEESAAAAEQLNAQSEALKGIVVRLNSMVGGNLAAASA
jgi:methyl-accepting chemotaxis protein/methyl-accepting chemotaxis protein-1 (serine sensor receptor)